MQEQNQKEQNLIKILQRYMAEAVLSNKEENDLRIQQMDAIKDLQCKNSQSDLNKKQQQSIYQEGCNLNIETIMTKQYASKQNKLNGNYEQQSNLNKIKSTDELKVEFKSNEKILESLSFNIQDLFKKISSLTQEVKSQIGVRPLSTTGSLQNIPSSITSCKKIQQLQYHSMATISEIPKSCQINKVNNNLPIDISNSISMRNFEIGRSLGYGKFGQVLQCRHKQTGCLFALKKIFKSTIEQYNMKQQFLVELEACKRMNHPNIIKTYISFTDQFHIFTISEYAQGHQLVKNFDSSQQFTSKVIFQVLQALKYIHNQGLVHRDLKPQNIIIDQGGMIKICDFGWANFIDKEPKMNILCGTLDYVCPQMVNQQEYSKQVDLWSVGVLTYQLLFGGAPFNMQTKTATFQRVRKLDYIFPDSYRFSTQSIDFISKLLKPQKQRMKLEDCLSHPFIVNYKKIEEYKNEYEQLFK